MKKLPLPLLAVLLTFAAVPLSAQDYRFAVPLNQSWVVIDFQGQATIHYRLAFACQPDGKPVDIVDIGLPNDSYVLESAEASVGGEALSDIRHSEYVKPGIEVHLGADQVIMPGDSATLAFSIKLKRLLYTDDKDRGYASFKFQPTWYGSEYVTGSTRLECHFVFPAGVTQEEPRYHDLEFTESWYDSAVSAPVYKWVMEDARPDGKYVFGASFPAGYVEASSIQRPPGPLVKFLVGLIGAVAAVFGFLLATMFFWLPALIIFLVVRVNRARKMKYMPPVVSVEGTGVRRGLTSPEAAILLEMPLDRVMTLILFGLAKKGGVAVLARQPKLKLKVMDPSKATEVYEREFLGAVTPEGTVSEKSLQKVAVGMVKSVNEKMRGYSRKESVKYYKQVIAQSWDEAKIAAGPEERSRVLEDNYDWMTMDSDYRTRVRDHYGTGHYYRPRWWDSYYGRPSTVAERSRGAVLVPVVAPAGKLPAEQPLQPGTTVPAGKLPAEAPDTSRVRMAGPALADAINSDARTLSPGLVGDVAKFSSKVTDVTNPVPVSSGSSGSSSSGGSSSCACACACAGCACACAGGGR
jgi:hypothetical protein